MDFKTHFSAKKKKDLVSIAVQFGLLTESKATAMTKDSLVLYLASQQVSDSFSKNSDNRQADSEIKPAGDPQILASDTPDSVIKTSNKKTTSKPIEKTPKKATSANKVKTSKDSSANQNTRTEKSSETAKSESPLTENIKPMQTVASRTRKTSRKPMIEPTSVDIETKEVSQSEPQELITQENSTSVAAEKASDKHSSRSRTSKIIKPKPDKKDSAHELPVSDKLPESTADVTVTDNDGQTGTLQPPIEEINRVQPADDIETSAEREDSVVSSDGSVVRSSSAPSKLKRSRGRKRSVIITPQNESRNSENEDAAFSSAEAETGDIIKDAAPVTLKRKEPEPVVVTGILEIMSEGFGFLRTENYLPSAGDVFLHSNYIRRFNLRTGDQITGPVRMKKDSDKYAPLQYIKEVNGLPPEKMMRRPHFDKLTPIYPDERYVLETHKIELSTRIIDLIAPIGKGQRGMIVSPPKAGKTILLQKIANAISINNPDTKLIVLLIDERPEEVTDMQRSINGEVVYSTFDKKPENHTKIVELVLERAMRLVELGQDVVILLDSMTRLSRAYNLTINPTGRTLSGGLDPGALYGPKRFFGAARNIENGGSLTIIATSLIDTGSRMDEVIFEEFKGTGNMEVYLDRKLSEKRIFPAIDINKSGTRREELLLSDKELDAVWSIRKAFGQLDTTAVTEMIINLLLKTQSNQQFVQSVNVSFNDKAVFEAMRGTRPAGTSTVNNANGNSNK
ncbi:MAG: transcription termination factor Rho [Clostridiaceae bacterium]|nr:transcription termination factor Rho [Clostridiaceae bacterium]